MAWSGAACASDAKCPSTAAPKQQKLGCLYMENRRRHLTAFVEHGTYFAPLSTVTHSECKSDWTGPTRRATEAVHMCHPFSMWQDLSTYEFLYIALLLNHGMLTKRLGLTGTARTS